jgi:PKD repeat protein
LAKIVVKLGSNETKLVNGSVPVPSGANVTFDGSKSTGGNLTYAWDFGDKSKGSNATQVHAYKASGVFNVTLTVASGNKSANATVRLTVAPGGPASGTVLQTEKRPFTGSLTGMDPNSCNTTTTGLDCKKTKFTIAATSPGGAKAIAKGKTLSLKCSSTVVWCSISLVDPAGKTVASGSAQAAAQNVKIDQVLPAGEYTLTVRTVVGASNSYTATLEIDWLAP